MFLTFTHNVDAYVPSAVTKWILLKALILVPSDKQVLIILDHECDVSCFNHNRPIFMSILSKS
jgi:hypothetical protein